MPGPLTPPRPGHLHGQGPCAQHCVRLLGTSHVGSQDAHSPGLTHWWGWGVNVVRGVKNTRAQQQSWEAQTRGALTPPEKSEGLSGAADLRGKLGPLSRERKSAKVQQVRPDLPVSSIYTKTSGHGLGGGVWGGSEAGGSGTREKFGNKIYIFLVL